MKSALVVLSFGGAAACFAIGLAGESGAWLLAMLGALALLTLGFYLAGAGSASRRDYPGA